MRDDRIWQSGPSEAEELGLAGMSAHREEHTRSEWQVFREAQPKKPREIFPVVVHSPFVRRALCPCMTATIKFGPADIEIKCNCGRVHQRPLKQRRARRRRRKS